MGRVRRYKRVKSIDPNSKRGRPEIDSIHDEPPDVFEEKERSRKRKERLWENDAEERDKLYQREALRVLREADMKKAVHEQEKTVESRKEGESMKAFKRRLKEQTRLTLRDEIQKLTKTAQRRKDKLKELKRKRKAKKKGTDVYEEEVIEFGHAADGRVRASDHNDAPSSFAKTDFIAFGERVERPPDLTEFTEKLKQRQQLAAAKKAARGGMSSSKGGSATGLPRAGEGAPRSSEEGTLGVAGGLENVSKRQAKAAKKESLSNMDGDDGVVSTSCTGFARGIIHSAGGKTASAAEMELLRSRVQAAYKDLKMRRRQDEITERYGKGKKGFVMIAEHL